MSLAAHTRWAARVVTALVVFAGACGSDDRPAVDAARTVGPAPPPVRVTMDELHASGGVPDGWRLTPPPGDPARGRAVFAAYGCAACHVVQGETFPQQGTGPGPELTGMGAHHPPGYFVEAILNPDAILVEGEGYASPQGRSTMPAYPDMPLVDLVDVVAYLASLTSGHNHAMMMAAAKQAAVPTNLRERPAPPPQPGAMHVVMRYDVAPGKLHDFEAWFAGEGRAGFLGVEGLVAIDTYVTGAPTGPTLVSIFTFRDQQAAAAFLDSPAATALGGQWDSFIGPHDHTFSRLPPVYPVPSLSGRR